MDTNLQTLLIVMAIVFFVALIIAVVLPFLKRKGVDVDNVLESAKTVLSTANATMETLRPFLPAGAGADTFDKIMSAAQVGVANAEQLCHIGKLPADKRKEAARQYINEAVKMMGIDMTPEVGKLIDGAIEANVLELGHVIKTA